MSIRDVQLLEAVTRMHEVARYVEAEFGKGTISQTIRKAADDLNDLMKKELNLDSAN